MPFLKKTGARDPITATYVQQVAAGSLLTSNFIFTNPSTSTETYRLVAAYATYDVAGGASAAVDLKVCTTTTAAASGTSALASTFDLTATARTPQKKAISSTFSSTLIPPGSSLSAVLSGTLTGLVGLNVVAVLQPLRGRTER